MSTELLALLQHPPTRILLVGDVILDEYLHGTVHRISPEAPVPVLEALGSRVALGGAANVAHNLRALGCDVTLCTAVGDDDAGRRLSVLLGEAGVQVCAVQCGNRPTTHKTRVMAQSHQMLRIDRETAQPLDGASENALMAEFDRCVGEQSFAGIVCSDYRKGVLTAAVLRHVVATATRRGLSVTADPKGLDYARYCGVDVITPNLHELQLASGVDLREPTDDRIASATERVLQDTQGAAILVTCGAEGMVLCNRQGIVARIPVEAREVYDVTGAGDTVIAVFSMALFGGADLVDAARLANVAAGIVVGKLGTATVSRSEMQTALRSSVVGAHKIVDAETLPLRLAEARALGRRIVCTNGCFDLLHAGHVDLLARARQLGDVLVVGLNTDASVRRLKGDGRPLVPEHERAEVLAALDSVGLVAFFDEDTPARLIEAVRPDVLVKGADYALTDIVGADFVQGYGGRVERLPLRAGLSTSAVIQRAVQRYG